MIHDLFLYDWRVRQPDRKGLHAFRHPRVALNNALKIFELSKKEQDIILKHMWPLTVIFPRYKESYIVTLVDKYCATYECSKYKVPTTTVSVMVFLINFLSIKL